MHDWLKRWSQNGVFNKIMSGLLQVGLKQGDVDFSHMAVDGAFSPAPGGGQQVDHGYKGKRSFAALAC